jgi:hypothetical protein
MKIRNMSRVALFAFLMSAAVSFVHANGTTESQLPVDRHAIEWMKSKILELYGWNPDEYELTLRANWDHSKLPLIVALPNKRKVDWSPKFYVLPDKSIVYPGQVNGLNRILAAVFKKIEEKDAKMLAELSIAFGVYGKPVGTVFTGTVEGRIPDDKMPRKDTAPALVVAGNVFTVEFYSYDYELLVLYNCTFKITDSAFQGQAVKLN